MMKWGPNTTLSEVDDHTKQEEATGKAVWDKLQAKELDCAKLTEDDYAALGEYFMGQMMGTAHAAMNEMMIRAHGEDGEEQIHAVMGKRLSGCDTTASVSSDWIGNGWMPMMWGGWPGWGSAGMMGYGFGHTSWITTLLIWVLLILGIVALWKRISKN